VPLYNCTELKSDLNRSRNPEKNISADRKNSEFKNAVTACLAVNLIK